MRLQGLLATAVFLALSTLTLGPARDVNAQRTPVTHTIFMSGIEIKGATTTDKLAAPPANPADLSKGYAYKAPGEADKNAPKRWEVSSYLFSPGFVAVQQGDTVILNVFVVNGDEHEVRVLAPDGQEVMPKAMWSRGREYRISLVAEKTGTYQLICSNHAPTMIASILVLPR